MTRLLKYSCIAILSSATLANVSNDFGHDEMTGEHAENRQTERKQDDRFFLIVQKNDQRFSYLHKSPGFLISNGTSERYISAIDLHYKESGLDEGEVAQFFFNGHYLPLSGDIGKLSEALLENGYEILVNVNVNVDKAIQLLQDNGELFLDEIIKNGGIQ